MRFSTILVTVSERMMQRLTLGRVLLDVDYRRLPARRALSVRPSNPELFAHLELWLWKDASTAMPTNAPGHGPDLGASTSTPHMETTALSILALVAPGSSAVMCGKSFCERRRRQSCTEWRGNRCRKGK